MEAIYYSIAGLSLIAIIWFALEKYRRLEDALSTSRAERYMLKKELQIANESHRVTQEKLEELKRGAISRFEQSSEEITVDDATLFFKDFSDDKN